MRKMRRVRAAILGVASGAMMLQFAGCFGGDPAGYFTAVVTSTVVSQLVSVLFSAAGSAFSA